MNPINIRITRKIALGNRAQEASIDISFTDQDPAAHVPGSVELVSELDSTLEPRLEWSPTLCNGKRVDYAKAEKACTALGEGWRLPTRMELESILDLTRTNPAIDTERFPDTQSGAYWSSTPYAGDSSNAWILYFSDGGAYYSHRDGNDAFARAVRSAPAGQ